MREVFPQNPGSPAAKDEWGQPTKAVHRNRLSALTTKCLLIGLPVCNAQHAQCFVAHWRPSTRLENPAFAALSLDFNALKWRSCWISVEGSRQTSVSMTRECSDYFRWGGESNRSRACAVSGAFERVMCTVGLPKGARKYVTLHQETYMGKLLGAVLPISNLLPWGKVPAKRKEVSFR